MPQLTVDIYEISVNHGYMPDIGIEKGAPDDVFVAASKVFDAVDDARCFCCDGVIGFYLWEDEYTGHEKGGFTYFWMVKDQESNIWPLCEDCVSPMDYKHLTWNKEWSKK